VKLYAVFSELFDNYAQIDFGLDPCGAFRYATRELATVECLHLNQMQFCVGAHRCAFTAERLLDGDFGISCACHPFKSISVKSQSPPSAIEPRMIA